MAVSRNRLTARGVASITKPGRHADGGNLYLSVSATGGKSWVFFYRFNGRQREMGLGSAVEVSLADARGRASDCQREIRGGRDPLANRSKTRAKTFGECADDYVKAKRPQWKSEVHAEQWAKTLTLHSGALRAIPVDQITTETLLAVLKPLWRKTPETASRTRARIESVLDAARAQGLRTGENPARWRGHLDQLFPKRQKLDRGHHAAMSYAEVPAFIQRLRQTRGLSALALEFVILTAVRTNEALAARWEEFDLKQGLWVIPPARMKAGIEHRVPIVGRAAEILASSAGARTNDYVFPGMRGRLHLSQKSMVMTLQRAGVPVTVHGFRSSFRDWVAEKTDTPHEVAEMALAHTIPNAVERAYRRGDLFEKRRRLMEVWGGFCEKPGTFVPPDGSNPGLAAMPSAIAPS